MNFGTQLGIRGPTATLALGASLLGLTSCWSPFLVCPDADDDMVASMPERLSATGLYEDILTDEITPGIMLFRPQFKLWSDGADKRRFMQLPAGESIDTSNMDVWRFPEGTKLWKEFSLDGVKLETRLLEKTGQGDGDWSSIAYVWNEDGSDAIAAPNGFVDVAGTSYNVPAAGECIGCHGGRASFVLGLSAIQLSYDGDTNETDLMDLEALGLLSDPPPASFEVPGDETERAALGYLHANCGNCHNQGRPDPEITPCMVPANVLDFWLTVDDLASLQDTPTYKSTRGLAIEPGDPGASDMIARVSTRQVFERMPPMGTEIVDEDAVALLTQWIEAMP